MVMSPESGSFPAFRAWLPRMCRYARRDRDVVVGTVHAAPPGTAVVRLKELRPGSAGGSEIRILFAFDPVRRAVLLVAGDKAGNWQRWYDINIPVAERRYRAHLADLETREYE